MGQVEWNYRETEKERDDGNFEEVPGGGVVVAISTNPCR